jgi:hypothetical protein
MSDVEGSVDTGNPEATAAPAPAPDASATPGAAPPAATTSWIDSVAEGDTRSWAESKGLHNGSFENVLGSYHNLEKLMGADRAGSTIHLLGDDATDEQRNEFYSKLGRPEEAAGYELAPPEGQSADFSNWAAGVFHKAGLSKSQAATIQGAWDEYLGAQQQGQIDAANMVQVDAEGELRKEWGAAFDQNVNNVDVYAERLGMTDEHLQGLKDSMGPVGAMKFINDLGGKIGEDIVDTGEASRGGVMTPVQAKQALGELNMNKEFMTAWLNKLDPGHNAAVEKKAQLSRLASGIAA